MISYAMYKSPPSRSGRVLKLLLVLENLLPFLKELTCHLVFASFQRLFSFSVQLLRLFIQGFQLLLLPLYPSFFTFHHSLKAGLRLWSSLKKLTGWSFVALFQSLLSFDVKIINLCFQLLLFICHTVTKPLQFISESHRLWCVWWEFRGARTGMIKVWLFGLLCRWRKAVPLLLVWEDLEVLFQQPSLGLWLLWLPLYQLPGLVWLCSCPLESSPRLRSRLPPRRPMHHSRPDRFLKPPVSQLQPPKDQRSCPRSQHHQHLQFLPLSSPQTTSAHLSGLCHLCLWHASSLKPREAVRQWLRWFCRPQTLYSVAGISALCCFGTPFSGLSVDGGKECQTRAAIGAVCWKKINASLLHTKGFWCSLRMTWILNLCTAENRTPNGQNWDKCVVYMILYITRSWKLLVYQSIQPTKFKSAMHTSHSFSVR